MLAFIRRSFTTHRRGSGPGKPAAQVPARAMFPTGQRTTWEKEDITFEAGFMLNGKAMLTVIMPAGALQETETDIEY